MTTTSETSHLATQGLTDQDAMQVADVMISTGLVRFSADEPFVLASGRRSPVYVNMRRLLSLTSVRDWFLTRALDVLAPLAGEYDVVCGGETAGIAFGAWLARDLDRPFSYVRKEPKGYGTNLYVEGDVRAGSRALLVEDLATDCASKVRFAANLRASDLRCQHAFAFFYYDVFPSAHLALQDAGLSLTYLCSWRHLLARAEATGDDVTEVRSFLGDPEGWSRAREPLVGSA